MPNEQKKAREKRPVPPERRNAQGDHEGSAHRPSEYDSQNPAKLPDADNKKPRGKGD